MMAKKGLKKSKNYYKHKFLVHTNKLINTNLNSFKFSNNSMAFAYKENPCFHLVHCSDMLPWNTNSHVVIKDVSKLILFDKNTKLFLINKNIIHIRHIWKIIPHFKLIYYRPGIQSTISSLFRPNVVFTHMSNALYLTQPMFYTYVHFAQPTTST